MATITQIAVDSGDFDILVQLLTAADLAETFDSPGDFTVFAPTDAAFARLAGTLGYGGSPNNEAAVTAFLVEALTGLGGGDPLPLLTDILSYHVSAGGKTLAEVAALSEVETLEGSTFQPGPNGTLIDLDPDAPDPTLVATDIPADNGIIHAIDAVLLPLDAPTFALALGDGGADALSGRAEANNLVGRGGSDVIRGGGGDDLLYGGGGADLMRGGKGDDALTGGGGSDIGLGARGDDALFGGGASDKLHGGRGADALKGGQAGDLLYGGKGEDDVDGGDGRDLVVGGRGDDEITGGAGADILRGGRGEDVFVYETGDGRDRVGDFKPGADALDLSDLGLASFAAFEALAQGRGPNTVLDFGDGDVLTLAGLRPDEIGEGDVIL
ncbi:MAG: fasciclin domain-containing protein [Pseudomonadota bacterium]